MKKVFEAGGLLSQRRRDTNACCVPRGDETSVTRIGVVWCRRGVEDETENLDGGLIGEEGGGVGVLGYHRAGQDRAGW